MLKAKNLQQADKPVVQAAPTWWRRVAWWVPLVYMGLTLVLTWPLVLNFGSGTVRGNPDNYFDIWNMWWLRTSIFEQHRNPYYTDLLFYPYRTGSNILPMYYQAFFPTLTIPGGLLAYLIGFAASFNVLVVLAFVLSGWAAYALAKYFIKSVPAAFVVGAVYTFSTFHFHNLSQGQLEQMWVVWIPLYLLFLHRSLDAVIAGETYATFWRRWRAPLLAALFLWLAAVTSWYVLLQLLLYTAGLGLYVLIRYYRQAQALLGRLLVIGVVAFVPLSPLLIATLRVPADSTLQLVDGPEVEVLQSSPVTSFFDPGRSGQWGPHFLGFVTLVLAGLGLWWGWRKGARWWAVVGAVALVLALGPYWHLDLGEAAAEQAVKNGVPLPYWLLSKLPLVNIGRSPIRFHMLGRLALAMLAGWAVLALISFCANRLKLPQLRAAQLVPAVALAFLVVEVQALPLPIDTLPQPAFFRQVAAEPGDFAIFELPMTNHYSEDNRRMYFMTQHHRPIAGGYFSRKTIDYFRKNGSMFGTYFDLKPSTGNGLTTQQGPRDLLASYNFRYVVNYKDEYPADDSDGFKRNEQFLEKIFGANARIYEDQWLTAWHVPQASGPVATLVAAPGFYPPERRPDGQDFRWATGQAGLTLLTPAGTSARSLQISFAAWSFAPENRLEVSYNGQVLATFRLYPGPQNFSLSLPLPPGSSSSLNFRTLAPAQSPQQLDPASSDTRSLAFALSQLTIQPENP